MSFKLLISNPILNVAILSWFFAQTLKGIISMAQTKEFSLERFTGSGGMPSSHSAMVSSVVFTAYLTVGWSSPVFALAVCFAFVVVYDAANVRFQVGKQGQLLNRFQELSPETAALMEREFKEQVGHSKLEVACGIILGFVITLIYWLCFLR